MDGRCWVCDGSDLRPVPGTSSGALTPDDVRISDSVYGTTGQLGRCIACGFVQCTDAGDVLARYAGMEDAAYEESRVPRALQMRRLLGGLRELRPDMRLLDVGAASGILVEEALRLGLRADGVEPSVWLSARARERGLPVLTGALPHPALKGPYDIVMLVDIIEHVERPVELLRQARELLTGTGRIVVVTPDRSSWAARLMGRRWWHYRRAHIGYFDLNTLDLAMRRVGMVRKRWSRPSWYFTLGYLLQRAVVYLPWLRATAARHARQSTIVPLNLRDSILAVYAPA
ncbi:MAG: Ubiquinone biosynthesis O-methyltransferase [Candidatus Omnitrophica bacterium]|nr:Ubiquinone biosynthesis O-methyltransferase [Candidatus Omnitrophota bacterium]